MIRDKLLRIAEKIEEMGRKEPSEAPRQHQLSITRLTLMPFGILMYNLKSFFLLCCIFAPLMAILSFATNNSLICGLGGDWQERSPFGCTAPNQAVYVTFLLLRLLLITVFLKSWYRVAVKKDVVYVRELLIINIQDWKLFATILLIVAINFLPIIAMLLLMYRVPNPDWLVESAYFALVSCGFWLPFVAIRFYCIPAFVAENTKLPKLGEIFKLTADNGVKLLFSFAVMLLFCALLMLYFLSFSEFLVSQNPTAWGIVSEVLYDVVLLAVMSLLMNYSVTQKYELFSADNEEQQK